jgi:thiazole/oxazole-forming peptide maturase SagD family component
MLLPEKGDVYRTQNNVRLLRPVLKAHYRTKGLVMSLLSLLNRSLGDLYSWESDPLDEYKRGSIFSTYGRKIEQIRTFNDAPTFSLVYAFPETEKLCTDSPRAKLIEYPGGGAADTISDAARKASGELFDRAALLEYERKKSHKLSITALRQSRRNFFDPSRVSFLADKISETDELHWVLGSNLTAGSSALLPAQSIFWDYVSDNFSSTTNTEKLYFEGNTNGCASHISEVLAVLSGLYEIIERDAFLLYWLNRAAPGKIPHDYFSNSSAGTLLQKCMRDKLFPHFLYLKTDLGIPVLSVALEDKTGQEPTIVFSAAAGANINEIAHKALLDVLHVYAMIRGSLQKNRTTIYFKSPDEWMNRSFSLSERVLLWSNPRMYEHLSFLLSGEEVYPDELRTSRYDSPEQELAHLLKRFKERGEGYEVYWYKAKTLTEQDGSVKVAGRVIVPELLPMYFNERNRPLKARRLKEFRTWLGLPERGEYNPWPHPFP